MGQIPEPDYWAKHGKLSKQVKFYFELSVKLNQENQQLKKTLDMARRPDILRVNFEEGTWLL